MVTQPVARTEFAAALNQIASERGITPEAVLDTIKAAMVAAYRKDQADQFNQYTEKSWEFEAEIDPTTGGAKIFRLKGKKTVDVTPPGFGRIAAQTAKQVILQRVREAEKDAIIEEYSQRVGNMVSGMVLRFDGKNVIMDIGRGQGIMPPEEQIHAEYYKLNQRLIVLIKDIRDTLRGRTIIVSRAAPQLVKELFSREVPEVNSAAVEIKAIAREAGVRTKIAVHSIQEGVDPVGSCVGQKGIRVQAVINELGGEKIDIIQYSSNLKDFITAALAPAEGLHLDINQKKQHAKVTVPDDQLSLAIGRGGQNVRLAAKLTGYKIDIKGTSSKASLSITGEEEFEIDQLKLSARVRKLLVKAGFTTIEALRRLLDSQDKIDGIGPKAQKEIEVALKAMPQLERTEPARPATPPPPPAQAIVPQAKMTKTQIQATPAPAEGKTSPVTSPDLTPADTPTPQANSKPEAPTPAPAATPAANSSPSPAPDESSQPPA